MRRRDVIRTAAVAGFLSALPAWAQETPPEVKPKSEFDRALEWLQRHGTDTQWTYGGITAKCTGAPCLPTGSGSAADRRAPAEAILAFLAAGHAPGKEGPGLAVKSALITIQSERADDGCLADRSRTGWMDQHLVASQAFADSYGLTQIPLAKSIATAALEFTLRAMNPEGGFRSDICAEDPRWPRMLSLCQFLSVSAMAELAVPASARTRLFAWFDTRLNRKTLSVSPDDPKLPGTAEDAVDRLAAAGLARVLMPVDVSEVRQDPLLPRIADKVGATAFVVDARKRGTKTETGAAALRSLFLRASFLHQMGRAKDNEWVTRALDELKTLSRTGGCVDGSFDPGPDLTELGADDRARGGRLLATSLAALVLATPRRFVSRVPVPKPAK